MGIKVCPERNRHGEPPSFATLNQTCLRPTRPRRVTPSGTWYKQELGLGHYEGRSWRGFHHHATLCIAAYGFLVQERLTIPPSGPSHTVSGQAIAVPRGSRSNRSAAECLSGNILIPLSRL